MPNGIVVLSATNSRIKSLACQALSVCNVLNEFHGLAAQVQQKN
jgi:hypothetical protein